MPHFYLSYSRRDSREFTQRLSRWLRLLGYDPWLDHEHDIPPGTPFSHKNEKAIKKSVLFLILLTPDSTHADGVAREELRYALANNIPILPIRIANVAMPQGITGLTWLEAGSDPASVFTRLPALLDEITEKAGAGKEMEPTEKAWWQKYRNTTIARDLKEYGARFTGRDWLFDQLKLWAGEKDSRILILSGEPGIGKSAIAARLATRMDVKGIHFFNPDDPGSCRPGGITRSLIFQFASQFPAYRETIETLGEPASSALPEVVFRTYVAEPLAAYGGAPGSDNTGIIVIDGLDEAASGGDAMIDFLAESLERLPPWLRVIATTKPDADLLERFRGAGIRQLTLDASSVDNQADLAEYVRTRVRELGMYRLKDVVGHIGNVSAGNFRYVKAVLDSRFIPGSNHQPKDSDADTYYQILHEQYLRMMKNRFPDQKQYLREIAPALACLAVPVAPVPEDLLVSALAKKRRTVVKGRDLSEKTVLAQTCTDDRRGALRRLRSLSPFIVRDESGLRLFHKNFADWLPGWSNLPSPYTLIPRKGFRRLADACLQELREKRADTSAHVLLYIALYVRSAGMRDQLPEVFANPHYVTAIDTRYHEEFLILWAAYEKEQLLCMKTLYGPVVEDVPGFDRTFAERVAGLLQDSGHHDEALKIFRQLEVIFTERRERNRAARVMTRQAAILIHRGHLNEALSLLKIALAIQRKYKDWREYAITLGCIGTIFQVRGDLKEAMKIFKDQENICRENGDRGGIMDALSSQALVIRNRGHHEDALLIFKDQARIHQGTGLWSQVARSRGVQALAYLDQGRSRMAMALLREQEMLCEELGDWAGVSNCLANQGFIYMAIGNRKRSREVYQHQEKICRDHDDRFGLAMARGHLGCYYLARGTTDEAMVLFMEQEQISREIHFPRGLAISFANQALVHNQQNNFKSAFRLAGAALTIAQEEGYANLAEKIQSVLEQIQIKSKDE